MLLVSVSSQVSHLRLMYVPPRKVSGESLDLYLPSSHAIAANLARALYIIMSRQSHQRPVAEQYVGLVDKEYCTRLTRRHP